MWVLFLTYAGMALESHLLFRAWRGKLLRRFPVFFFYIFFVLIQSLLRRLVYPLPSLYGSVFWTTEFLGVFVGCAVVFEFYKISLAGYPGTARISRNALLLVFALTVGKVLLTAAHLSDGWSGALTVQLVRDMRFVQVAAMLTLLLLFLVYRIPTNRNLSGIAFGYGFYLVIGVANFTYLDRFHEEVLLAARYIQSSAYLIALCIWTIALWSYGPLPERTPELRDYASILAETDQKLAVAKSSMERALHP
jgi:hypothetical protein